MMNPFPFTAYSNLPDDKLKQYGVLAIGLAMAGGFAFGGMASYAGLTPSGNGQQGSQGERPEVPNTTFSEGESFDYGFRTQGALAYNNNVVFVTGVYSTQDQLEQMRSLEQVPSTFNDRVYVQLVNQSSSPTIARDFGLVEYPKVVLVGGQLVQRGGQQSFYSSTLDDVSNSAVQSAVCDGFRDFSDEIAAVCV